MSGKLTRVIPRKGVQLAGVPASGADVPADLADEWVAAGLARKAKAPAPPATTKSTPATPAKEG